MKDWEKAERIVQRATGGRRTPGSGNKGLQGDLIADNHYIEVKQTSKGSMSLNISWFETCEKNFHKKDYDGAILAIFFKLKGYCYFLDHTRSEDEPFKKWTSKKVMEDELPDTILTKKYVWIKRPFQDLRNLS